MRGQGLVEYAMIIVLCAVVVIVLIALLFNPKPPQASNEFCRTDLINKLNVTTCITPAAPCIVTSPTEVDKR